MGTPTQNGNHASSARLSSRRIQKAGERRTSETMDASNGLIKYLFIIKIQANSNATILLPGSFSPIECNSGHEVIFSPILTG